MPIVAAAIALAALVWGAIYARRGSLAAGFGLLLLVSYALGHEFWNAKVGPIPLTLDRLLLIGLAAAFAVRWRLGQLPKRPLTASDWMLAATLLLFAASALVSGQPEFIEGATSKWGRLVTSFIIPGVLFVAVRQAPLSRRELTWVVAGFAVFGVYLGATAILEITGQWSLVFPRYIADPARGIHFGRARGPQLNSVSLGIYLTACFWCAWTLLTLARRRWMQLALVATLPLMAAGVYFTYTRSTWIGLAASGLVVAAIEIPRRWRLPAITMAGLFGLLVLATSWTQLVGIEREGTAADAAHSVDQRKSFAYVSWQMFCDHPLTGVGFGRFYDRKLPYLSDRSQDFELDSIRPLDHHNTLLSVLTETGIIGLTAYLGLLAAWARTAWSLARKIDSPRWVRAQGVLFLALTANFLCSAVFHDLTFLSSQHALLFVFAGLTVNARQLGTSDPERERSGLKLRASRPYEALSANRIAKLFDDWGRAAKTQFDGRIVRFTMDKTAKRILGRRRQPGGDAGRQVSVLGVGITDVAKRDALRLLEDSIRAGDGRCRSIFLVNAHTLNVATDEPYYRDVLNTADFVFNDGTGVRWAARQRGIELHDNLCGTDLIPDFLQATAGRGYRYFLLGADPKTIEQAADVASQRFAGWTLAGYHHGFVHNGETDELINRINASGADLLLVGMGNPIQERWIRTHQAQLQIPLAIGVGGLFDHWIDKPRRAPLWVRRAGCEWMHKLLLQPHKWRRYLIGNPKFLYRITRSRKMDVAAMQPVNGAIAGRASSFVGGNLRVTTQ